MNDRATLVLRCSSCGRKLARITHPERWHDRGGGREWLRLDWRPDVEAATFGEQHPGSTLPGPPQSYAAACPGRSGGAPCRRPIRIRHDSLALWWADAGLDTVPETPERITRERLV